MSCNIPMRKFRSKKEGVKAHVLYDIEAQVPAFYTITTASKYDSTQYLQSIMKQMLTIYSTELMTPLKNSIGYILQTLSLLSEPKRT